ncbi:hypothetical protein QBC47DRAFT_343414 [Echria macrotheca]|uniref:Uncharacterized protein n=1 Tax=Echria macrotheca TaxID=438768 RepID=A0AAJ0BGR6_9PEZI|nr:hypothetical protein QBC47DRAFT_343414 [Echria macrotheca]
MADTSPDRKRPRTGSVTNGPHPDDPIPAFARPLARWCRITPGNGPGQQEQKIEWDTAKIKCFLSDKERSDTPKLRNLLDGSVVDSSSSRIHPLLFDTPTDGDENIRSLPFLRSLISDPYLQQQYSTWNTEKKRVVGLAVRDLYLASTTPGLLTDDECSLLVKLAEVLDDTSGVSIIEMQGMTISFHPTPSRKVAKFIEDLDTKLPSAEWIPFFAQVLGKPRLFTVFVDAAELSYHNFENIIPLDSWVEDHTSHQPPSFTFDDVHPVQSPETDTWSINLTGPVKEILLNLAMLDLYVPPLNKSSRGGARFIFHSAILSRALTAAVRASDLLNHLASVSSDGFAFVNPVFRVNKFSPSDAAFSAHRDTPYFDAARSHVSRYTLLIYLSAGTNPDGVLQIDNSDSDVMIDRVGEFECIVMDQRHSHTGRPFTNGTKLFLRTELVFHDTSVSRENYEAASLFSTACYLTGPGVFDDEIAAYAHACFERANALRWSQITTNQQHGQRGLFLYKQLGSTRWLTNGYDYWFPHQDHTGDAIDQRKNWIIDCAVLAVLDYFNAKLADHGPFRLLCRTTTLRETITCTADAFRVISSREATPTTTSPSLSSFSISAPFHRLTTPDIAPLFHNPEQQKEFTKRPRPSWEDSDDSDSDEEEGCCPAHTYRTFNAFHSADVAAEYTKCLGFCTHRLRSAPILLLGNNITLNESQIERVDDKIFFYSDRPRTTRINFAACWGDAAVGAELYITSHKEIPALRLLIPPVLVREYPDEGGGVQLVLDFFRNDWMVSSVDDSRVIPVPAVTNEVPEEVDEEVHAGGPYWRRVREVAGGDDEGEIRGSFWTRGSDDEDGDGKDSDEDEDEDEEDDEEEEDSHIDSDEDEIDEEELEALKDDE